MANETSAKHVTRVTSGGETVVIDSNAAKAADRYERSQDLTNIVNRRVRKTFGAITGARP